MRKNPERAAWIILILSFFTFCLFTVSIPLVIRAYLYNATDSYTSMLTSIRGTVLAKPYREEQPVPLTRGNSTALDELTIVFTDDTSQATLALFEGSDVTLYNNTTIIIQKTQEPRFSVSPHSPEIRLELLKGRIRVNVPESDANRFFQVKSPHGQATLMPGSYAIETDNTITRLTTRAGVAYVFAQETRVTVAEGELSTITSGNPPSAATTAERNLLANGNFAMGLSNAWQLNIYVPTDPLTDTTTTLVTKDGNWLTKTDTLNGVTSTLQLVEEGGQSVLHFESEGANNVHSEASIEQLINKDVQDSRSLKINAQIRLEYQSLPGGGQLGTEFPIMIELNYRDTEGDDRTWHRGFYYEPAPSNYILYNEPNNGSEGITRLLWYPYESENILLSLEDQKPAYIKSIRIYASGWIYKAMVTDIKLLAED